MQRNWRGAQREDVHEGAQALEFFLVHHAEALLFVNDDEAEILEGDVFLHDAVRADDDVHRATRQILDGFLLLALGAETGEQFQTDWVIGHAFAEIIVVLLR